MEKAPLISFITAMFTILNPIGSIAIFAGMVSDYPAADRRKVAVKCAIAVAVILVVTVWAGEYLLDLFGVEVPGLQAAGGLIIALIALSMLHSRRSAIHDTAHNEEAPAPDQDIAVVPLAIAAGMFAAGAKGLLPGLSGGPN
jgi:multiple antibiotic resistance protein